MESSQKLSTILFVSTYPPRECGIATFTYDLKNAVQSVMPSCIKTKVLALNNETTSLINYSQDVIFQINSENIREYSAIAGQINQNKSIKLICIQHEFGIFGGLYGKYLLRFLEKINKPLIVTFHTVLPRPNQKIKKIVASVCQKAKKIVVMTDAATNILKKYYGVKDKIVIIPHGTPSVPFTDGLKEKISLGLRDNIVLSSFGMLSPNKGCEYLIEALPDILKKFPTVNYLIIGKTHPIVQKQAGEKYRDGLIKKIKSLGLQNNVKFYNKYLTLKELLTYLKATDIYISTGLDPSQITSGTLSYAMSCGKAIISTPFQHARDAITPDRGLLVKYKNPKSYRDCVLKILENPKLKMRMERNSYAFSRIATWHNVARSYQKIFFESMNIKKDLWVMPKIKFNHLRKLTDNFGIMQFAKGQRPDKAEGYTLDDNARAMIACCKSHAYFKNEKTIPLIQIYLNFINYVQRADGRLFNYVNYQKTINYNFWSDDSHGRAIWSLGLLLSHSRLPQKIIKQAEIIFKKALNASQFIKSPRAIAFIILGLCFYCSVKPAGTTKSLIKRNADFLADLYQKYSEENWRWFEPCLTYSNSKLPEALFHAYRILKDEKYLNIARTALDFLLSITLQKKYFAPIGHKGWYIKNKRRAYFDQQPVDAASTLQTLVLAYEITQDKKYIQNAKTVFQWFLGRNYLNQMIYDESSGGCHDGLGKNSININQGAESTISYLIARLTLHPYHESKK